MQVRPKKTSKAKIQVHLIKRYQSRVESSHSLSSRAPCSTPTTLCVTSAAWHCGRHRNWITSAIASRTPLSSKPGLSSCQRRSLMSNLLQLLVQLLPSHKVGSLASIVSLVLDPPGSAGNSTLSTVTLSSRSVPPSLGLSSGESRLMSTISSSARQCTRIGVKRSLFLSFQRRLDWRGTRRRGSKCFSANSQWESSSPLMSSWSKERCQLRSLSSWPERSKS